MGTQYRSAIFYHTDAQREKAEAIIRELNIQRVFPNPIVTEVTRFEHFYPAEDYHQDYYTLNGGRDPYCRAVILPKVEKLEKYFRDRLKK